MLIHYVSLTRAKCVTYLERAEKLKEYVKVKLIYISARPSCTHTLDRFFVQNWLVTSELDQNCPSVRMTVRFSDMTVSSLSTKVSLTIRCLVENLINFDFY